MEKSAPVTRYDCRNHDRFGPEAGAGTRIEHAFASIAVIHQRMSFHDPNSVLSRVNREAFVRPVVVDEKTFQVLTIARDFFLLSDGLFDPTIAPTLQRAGFLPASGEGPTRSDISFADVELLSDNRVRFRRPGVCLDLGGTRKVLRSTKRLRYCRERASILHW
jgi:FAD:protein FMN transferase